MKWDYLIESDERFRRLKAKLDAEPGDIELMTAYARELRSRGMLDRFFELIAMDWEDLVNALGVPHQGKVIPKHYEGNHVIDGVLFRVNASKPGSKSHRIKVQCPVCKKWMGPNGGKIGQHFKRRDHAGSPVPSSTYGLIRYMNKRNAKHNIYNILPRHPRSRIEATGDYITVTVIEAARISRLILEDWMFEHFGLGLDRIEDARIELIERIPGAPFWKSAKENSAEVPAIKYYFRKIADR